MVFLMYLHFQSIYFLTRFSEQKEEQRKLRHEYIQSVRANLRAQLNNVSIKNEDGSITPLKPKGLN